MSEITTTKIDVEKIKGIFDDIFTFMIDENRYDSIEDTRARAEIGDAIIQLTTEIVEIMYNKNMQFYQELTKEGLIDLITRYKQTQLYLNMLSKDTDILQA